jgi:hypothetical protein
MKKKADCCDLCPRYSCSPSKERVWATGCARLILGAGNIVLDPDRGAHFQQGYCKAKQKEVICCSRCEDITDLKKYYETLE